MSFISTCLSDHHRQLVGKMKKCFDLGKQLLIIVHFTNPIILDSETLEEGRIIDEQEGSDANVKARIGKARIVQLYGAKTWRATTTIIKKVQRTNQFPVEEEIRKRHSKWVEYTLQKSPNCITRQALTWNSERKRKRGRPKNTLCQEDRVGWRVLLGGLYSYTRSNRSK
ncbi:hypothetical protein MS3_00007206 [Schistosoma haematobium]|uniref:Uncharacterized protein n=1 Tax=Schistosoma haematobium TaxID=6185 RepID=A0A6A5DHS7_SCHHA|nr:hypothetical protein MS3_00007206 [Schistosoma haematobium]KAH9582444.1 hypothetical protein MS3_00007206 [Schistosoma haematobium]